jgi:hypothetical protein
VVGVRCSIVRALLRYHWHRNMNVLVSLSDDNPVTVTHNMLCDLLLAVGVLRLHHTPIITALDDAAGTTLTLQALLDILQRELSKHHAFYPHTNITLQYFRALFL